MVAVNLIGSGIRSSRAKSLTFRKSPTHFIAYELIPWVEHSRGYASNQSTTWHYNVSSLTKYTVKFRTFIINRLIQCLIWEPAFGWPEIFFLGQ